MSLGLDEVRGSRANRLLWLLISPLYAKLTDAPSDAVAEFTAIQEAGSQ